MRSVAARVARLEADRPSVELVMARAALAELGRGLAAVAELLDGPSMAVGSSMAVTAPADHSMTGGPYMTGALHDGAMLARVADGGSLLGRLAGVLSGVTP